MKLRRSQFKGVGLSLDNWDTPSVKYRMYLEVSFWRSSRFNYIKLPVSGGSTTGLHIGPLHICWGGWRALNWD